MVMLIDYSLKNPVDGIQFVLPSDAYSFVSISLIAVFFSLTPLSVCSSHVRVADFTGRCMMLGPVHRQSLGMLYMGIQTCRPSILGCRQRLSR